MLRYVSDDQRGMLGDIAAAQDDDVLAGLVRAAQRDNLWADVLPVTRAMGEDSRARFAKLKAIQTRPVLSSIVDAAKQRSLWTELLMLLPLLPAASRRRVAALGTGFGRSILAEIIRVADEEQLWAPLLGFAVELEVRTQRDMPPSCSAPPTASCSPGMLDAVEEDELQDELVELVGRLHGDGDARVRQAAGPRGRRGARRRARRRGRGRGAPGIAEGAHVLMNLSGRLTVVARRASDAEPYGAVGRSEWMDVDWQQHLHWIRIEERWLNYVEMGDPGDPPLIFIHGLSGCWQNWLEQIPHFAQDHRVIAVDLPGFGQSEMPVRDDLDQGLCGDDRRADGGARDRCRADRRPLDGRLHRRGARDRAIRRASSASCSSRPPA